MIQKILAAEFDSRNPGKVYAYWTSGESYEVYLTNGEKIEFGWRSYDHFWLINGAESKPQFLGKWKEISLSDIHKRCQEYLASLMGEAFPWEKSSWGTKEAYQEWSDPQTFLGKLKKASRDWKYFREVLLKDSAWIVDKTTLNPYSQYEEIALVQGHWVKWYPRHEQEPIILLAREEGEKLFKEYSSKMKLLEEEKALARKEHARKCGVVARKYGLPFVVVLRCFKGDEEQVKNFSESLKEAFGKEYNPHELMCGRARRRNELDYLGINFGYADPNLIAEYVLDCLEAGKILKETSRI